MVCPFRKNKKVKEQYEFKTKEKYYNISEYFSECEKDKCPYYKHDFGDICMRVKREMIQCGIEDVNIGGINNDL